MQVWGGPMDWALLWGVWAPIGVAEGSALLFCSRHLQLLASTLHTCKTLYILYLTVNEVEVASVALFVRCRSLINNCFRLHGQLTI